MHCSTLHFTLALVFCVVAIAPLSAGVLYDNGPITIYDDAWPINYSIRMTDSFDLTAASHISGFEFVPWVGGTPYYVMELLTVDWAITSTPFGAPLASGTAAPISTLLSGSVYAHYWIFDSTVSGLSLSLPAGRYWLELSNATANHNTSVYWDQNAGPSMACTNWLVGCGGDSNAFRIEGTPVPEAGTAGIALSEILAAIGVLRLRRRSRLRSG